MCPVTGRQILNLEEAAQTNFTRAAFEGSTHYVQARLPWSQGTHYLDWKRHGWRAAHRKHHWMIDITIQPRPCSACLQESDWLPEQLAAAFPWLKMAISMREPISQAIAMLLHNVQHGRA